MRHRAFAEKLGTRVAKITIDEGHSFLAYGHDAFLIAFADAADATDGAIEVHHAQAGQLRNAQAAGVKDFEHGAIAQADGSFIVGLSKEFFHFFQAQIIRKGAADFGRFEI